LQLTLNPNQFSWAQKMIEIIPSIAVLHGKVEKLGLAKTFNATLYEKSPLGLAQYFESHGFKRIHLVDQDGAKEGQVVNYQTLQLIKGYTNLAVNFSGGIRTDGGVSMAFENGAQTVTVATIPVTQPDRFMNWLISFGRNRIVLGADVVDGKISPRFNKGNSEDVIDFISYYQERGIVNLKLTDVARDGELLGPNFELVERVVSKFPNLKILVSGGVRSVADIETLNEMGVSAVIIARAFYEDRLPLEEMAKYTGVPFIAD
jgi:phosphoribosylformimino-5-aminoimidazole carboxamide ribotide isomerase